MSSRKRVGLSNRKEGKALEKALSGEHADVSAPDQGDDQTHAQPPVQAPAPPQGHEPATERLHCLLPPSQKEYIEELAGSWDVSQGAVIRYLIEYYQARSREKNEEI